MIKPSNVINISEKRNESYISIIISAMAIFFLLLMRDAYSVGISKYLFLAIVCLCAVCMKTNHLIYLFCFLFPLYVGLPGNYMTLVLIIRLILETPRFKVSSLLLSIAIATYMFMQNIITEYTGIVPMMFIAGVIVILLLFTYKRELEPLSLIFMYSAGVAALGLIMLLSTLNYYGLKDLLSTSSRLGTSSVNYAGEGIMNVSVDPNFYGMFSMASISRAFPLIIKPKTKSLVKICLCLFILTQLIVCFIGLSRSFILVFAAWVVLYLLLQNNLKGKIIALIAIVATVILIIKFMPDVITAALSRFIDPDIVTGNGRIALVKKYWYEWSSNIYTLLFGVGMYNCNVHCMPLQFLFGGGLIMFCLVSALSFTYKTSKLSTRNLFDLLPFIVTFTMMCVVPAAGLLNYIFPLVFIGLSSNDMKKVS